MWCRPRRCRCGWTDTDRRVEAVRAHGRQQLDHRDRCRSDLARQNIRATLDLLAVVHHDSGKRLIYASSAATYGDGSGGFDDDPACAALARCGR